MGQGAVPPGLLVTPAELSRWNVPSLFLAQFEPRPFQILISTGGPLGTMAVQWQWAGDTSGWSASIVSDSGSAWSYTIDDVFADLTFTAQSYVLNTVYTVDRNGVVTGGAGVTATRFDLRQNACSAATTEAMTRMRDAIRPPLTKWGDDATTHAAAMAYAILKRGRGATPKPAGGENDVNIFTAEERALKFFEDIGKGGKPDSMTDTSTSVDGPLLPVYPFGDTPRNW